MLNQGRARYCRVALFGSQKEAESVCLQISDLIESSQSPGRISVFLFQIIEKPEVAVIGDNPPEELDKQIEEVLDQGVPLDDLPKNTLSLLEVIHANEEKSRSMIIEQHFPRPAKHFHI